MKLISSHNSLLQCRLVLAILIAFAIIIADSKFNLFSDIRKYMDTIISSPLYIISSIPCKLLDNISYILSSRNQLKLENNILHKELLLKKSELLVLAHYKQENASLRKLLNSPLLKNEQKMLTKVISIINNPYNDQVIINKGSINGVYEGQPVISDKGIVGQVITVAKLTSRVMLICDATHALPIQVLRNNIRIIADGSGHSNILQLKYLPINTDIRIGDMLISSGLDGKFPEGYPVAVVSTIKLDSKRACTIIQARPTADLQNLNYLLLLWKFKHKDNNVMTPEEVNHVANERLLTQIKLQTQSASTINSACFQSDALLNFIK